MRNLLLFALFSVSFSFSQDIHFTNYEVAPSIINPALTGNNNGWIRATAMYRTQWSAVSKPFSTYGFDFSINNKSSKRKSFLGFGLSAFRDVAGSSRLTTNSFTASIAGIVKSGKNGRMSGGISLNVKQMSINNEDFQWGNQYNGHEYDASLPSNELQIFQNLNLINLAGGFTYTFGQEHKNLRSKRRTYGQIGLSYFYFLKPDNNFLSIPTNILNAKYVAHGEFGQRLGSTNTFFKQRINLLVQGTTFEANVGIFGRFLLRESSQYRGSIKGLAFSAGAYYRVLDAIAPAFELEYGNFTLAMSYDINLSRLTPATAVRGGFEVSLKFLNPSSFKY